MPTPLKHRWSLAHNHLTGITAGAWLRLLRTNRFSIDFAYAHRVLLITAASLANSFWACIESLRFSRAIARVGHVPPPVFIIGHWRSGTTHLHNILARDAANFAFPSTYEVVNPLNYLTTQGVNSRLFRWMVPPRRPMDNVALSFDSPQEDEIALCLLHGKSPYLAITFPRNGADYQRYLTMRDVAPAEVDEWKAAFLDFIRKLTFKHQSPLLLKSPPHTARIRLLLGLFPEARFIHIHRDPHEVIQSTRHYFDTAAWHTYLQKPDRSRLDDEILARYIDLHGAYFEQQPLIPRGQFHELAFSALERDPMGELRLIYESLAVPGFEAASPRFEQYLATLKGYRKNDLAPLPAELRDRVSRECGRCFEAWGYPNH
jgi:hypothetical protein